MAAPAAKRMKGPTAYMLFSEEQRPDIMSRLRAEAPDGKVAVTVIAKVIGELWKGLSDSDKAAYKEKAQKRAIEVAEAAAAAAAEAAGEGAAEQDYAPAPPAADPGLPRGVVKKIIMLDPEVQRVSADGLWLVGEATRMFLHALAAKGAAAVTAKKRKTIMLQDFETLVRSDKRLVEAGMKDIVHNKSLFFGAAAAAAAAAGKHKPPSSAADGGDGKQQHDQHEKDDPAAAAEEPEEQLTDEQRVALAEAKQQKAAAAAKARAAKAAERQAARAAAEAAGSKRITTFFAAKPKQQQQQQEQQQQQQHHQRGKENQGASSDTTAAAAAAAAGDSAGGVKRGPAGEFDVAAELEAELDAALAEDDGDVDDTEVD